MRKPAAKSRRKSPAAKADPKPDLSHEVATLKQQLAASQQSNNILQSELDTADQLNGQLQRANKNLTRGSNVFQSAFLTICAAAGLDGDIDVTSAIKTITEKLA